MVDGPRRIDELLRTGDISALKREARRRRQLVDAVRERLPQDLAAHVYGAHLEPDGRLIVAMDSAAWAAKLKFLGLDYEGRDLTVKVAPAAVTRG